MSPKGWADAGVGIGIEEGGKIPLVEKINCLSSLNRVENSKMSISCLFKILIPYSRFSRIYKTDLWDLWAHVFSDFLKFSSLEVLRFPKITLFKTNLGFFL